MSAQQQLVLQIYENDVLYNTLDRELRELRQRIEEVEDQLDLAAKKRNETRRKYLRDYKDTCVHLFEGEGGCKLCHTPNTAKCANLNNFLDSLQGKIIGNGTDILSDLQQNAYHKVFVFKVVGKSDGRALVSRIAASPTGKIYVSPDVETVEITPQQSGMWVNYDGRLLIMSVITTIRVD